LKEGFLKEDYFILLNVPCSVGSYNTTFNSIQETKRGRKRKKQREVERERNKER
jgi:hypothetical protein